MFGNDENSNSQTQHNIGVDQSTDHNNKADESRSHSETVGDDLGHKYDLALKFKAKHKSKLYNCNIFKEWDNQTIGKFGYISISDQTLAQGQGYQYL